MNFLGIGTGELIVILIIAVLVVGPDKMVELAGKLGVLIARLRQMTDGATQEFREALAIDEIKEVIQGVSDEVKDVGQEMKGTAAEVAAIGVDAQSAVKDAQDVAEGKVVAPPQPVARGPVPQNILDMMGPPTQTVTSDGTAVPGASPVAQDLADREVEPVTVQATRVVVDDQDEEAIELDDVIVVEPAGDNHRDKPGSAA